MEYIVGQRWVSHADAQLGLGVVVEVDGRRVTLSFPAVDEERTYAADTAVGDQVPAAAVGPSFGHVLRRGSADEGAETLSGGEQQMLAIARGMMSKPKLLMLDEPAAGMNEKETEALGLALQWVHGQSDCAMLVIDHDLKFIMSLCSHIFVLNMGALIAAGSPVEISRNPTVIDAYLGEDHENAA